MTAPAVQLHTEKVGTGPRLLLIPGGTGDAASFGALRPHRPRHLRRRFR